MKGEKKKQARSSFDWYSFRAIWGSALLTAGLIAGVFVLFLIFCGIILMAGKLGYGFVPVMLGYISLLAAGAAYLLRRKKKREFMAVVGKEVYYEVYPREKRRMERREAAKKARANRCCRLQ